VTVKRDTADAFVDRYMAQLLDGFELKAVSSARELREARAALEDAQLETERWVDLESAIDRDDWLRGYEIRKARQSGCRDRVEALEVVAGEAVNFPQDAEAWALCDDAHKRQIARSVIDHITVRPAPVRGRLTTEATEGRFAVSLSGAPGWRDDEVVAGVLVGEGV
jgi:hypothetical protein